MYTVDCQFVYRECQPVFHIFLYFSYTGAGALEGPYQSLLCCWRLPRPSGESDAEEEALLVRGKSQIILHGSLDWGPRRFWPASPSCSAWMFSMIKKQVFTPWTKCMAAASSLSKPSWEDSDPGRHYCGGAEREDSLPRTVNPSTSLSFNGLANTSILYPWNESLLKYFSVPY